MISKFLQEQRRFTQKELCDLLECPLEESVHILRRLKEFGVVKAVKASDWQRDLTVLEEQDVEIAEIEPGVNDYYYVFPFVGVIVVSGRVLKCYPKYITSAHNHHRELKQIIKVLEKYNASEQIIHMYSDSTDGRTFNILALLLFLLNDYYENGVYSNTQDVVEINGNGEILWDHTINETFALIHDNRPYYTDIKTRHRVTDDYDFFTRLHKCIISIASEEMQTADLLDLFDISPVDLSDEELSDFGERDYVLDRIERELSTQFNTRKQILLKALYTYVSQDGALADIDAISMFGTNSFNLVWEKVCSEVLDNQLQTPLGGLPFPGGLHPEYERIKEMPLKDIIEHPAWVGPGFCHTSSETLIPDLITLQQSDGRARMVIFDAKYYTPQLEPNKPLKAQPGIESIVKQYLYQLAYKDFVAKNNVLAVANCFIMPTEESAFIDKGFVSLRMLEAIGLEAIKIRLLPAELMYEHYIHGTKMSIEQLDLFPL